MRMRWVGETCTAGHHRRRPWSLKHTEMGAKCSTNGDTFARLYLCAVGTKGALPCSECHTQYCHKLQIFFSRAHSSHIKPACSWGLVCAFTHPPIHLLYTHRALAVSNLCPISDLAWFGVDDGADRPSFRLDFDLRRSNI
jgi:hypothetical protein